MTTINKKFDSEKYRKSEAFQKFLAMTFDEQNEYMERARQNANPPKCTVCNGQKWLRNDEIDDVTDPNFGKLKPCPKCQDKEIAAQKAGLREKELEYTLDDIYHVPENAEFLNQAVNVFKLFLAHGHGCAWMWSEYGQGKTKMGRILAAETKRKKLETRMILMVDLLDDLRQTMHPDSKVSLQERINYWINLDVLIIDEADKVNSTDWVAERFFQIINRRHDNATEGNIGITLIICNSAPIEISGAFESRFREDPRCHVIEHPPGEDGADARPMAQDFE